jgi:hypothetical protein
VEAVVLIQIKAVVRKLVVLQAFGDQPLLLAPVALVMVIKSQEMVVIM